MDLKLIQYHHGDWINKKYNFTNPRFIDENFKKNDLKLKPIKKINAI